MITILSKMQVDVRNAETEVLNHLYSQIDAESFKFNKLMPIVIPTSNYVTLGSDYEARVFISATDTTQAPVITVNNTVLPSTTQVEVSTEHAPLQQEVKHGVESLQ